MRPRLWRPTFFQSTNTARAARYIRNVILNAIHRREVAIVSYFCAFDLLVLLQTICLTRDPMVGGPKGPPLWLFVDNPKTVTNFAVLFSVPPWTSISRIS